MALEVGMIIYSDERLGGGIRRYTIKRVTEKQAVIEEKYSSGEVSEVRFDREQRDGYGFYAKGNKTGWNRTIYYIETPELKSKYYFISLCRKFASIKSNQLTAEQLEQIIAIAFPKKSAI